MNPPMFHVSGFLDGRTWSVARATFANLRFQGFDGGDSEDRGLLIADIDGTVWYTGWETQRLL